MQPAALRTLEFDRIREALAQEALTPLGRSRALALLPSSDPDDVGARLALATEAAGFVADAGTLGLFAPADFDLTLELLGVDDQPLEPLALLGLARFVTSVSTVAGSVRGKSAAYPRLRQVIDRVAGFDQEADAIDRAIDPAGDVRDSASPALRDIRDALRRQRSKLRTSLESLTRGRDTAKYLQDQIVTDRNGRYVVVVRAEHRDAIPGIVHGSSTSGASLYLEPMPVVALNNEVAALVGRERDEIRRILLALADAFRARADEFGATLDAAADIDELHAKTALARRMSAVAPALADDGRIEFLGARHPLLILGRDAGVEPVPSDLKIVPPVRALVISGPNTGGKTVALKAFGLLAVMAQAGLLIPVEKGSRFTPFATVFANIGDEQSIAASLSTFSAHIASIVEMDRALELPALVLLDEVGSGTDPVEGGALGTAIIEHFKERGAVVVATTHDDVLKSYAATTEGVITAGFGFDPDTYAPTYRIVYGSPGRSLALEIAERLGMPASVIASARSRRSTREAQLAEHIARLDREMANVARERASLEDTQRALEGDRTRLLDREARLAEKEAVLKRRLDDKLNERLREARVEVDRIVGNLKKKADTLAEQAEVRAGGVLSTGEVGGIRAEARAALGALETSTGLSASNDEGVLASPPDVGQKVYVPSFGAEGVVRGVSGKNVEVEIRGMRTRVKIADLRSRGDAEKKKSSAPQRSTASLRGSSGSLLGGDVSAELMLIGTTVDEALERAERFLDAALLSDTRRLRVVHGHGTGKLREALRAFFKTHPLVASVTAAADNEGGQGATIVELKD